MVLEYRVNWQGPTGGPGVTVLHGRPSDLISDQDAANELSERAHAFFSELTALVPSGYTLSFPGEVVELNTTTGALEDVYAVPPQANVVMVGGGDWGAPAGARIEWRTSAIVAGRRLQGRTFIVPITALAFDTSGTLDPEAITALTNAAEEYLTGGTPDQVDPCIWSRTHGILADITAYLVPDEVTILRSRRD